MTHQQFTGLRDLTYTLQMAAEKAEWLAGQARVHGGLPVYDALTILNEQAALLRTLEAEARAAVERRVKAIREGLTR